jgi:hypothetical protein
MSQVARAQRRIRIEAEEMPVSAYREFWRPLDAPAGKLFNLRLNYAFECDGPLTVGQRVDLISPGNLVTPVRIIGANDGKFIATDCTAIGRAQILKLVAVVVILGAIAAFMFTRSPKCSYPGCTANGTEYVSYQHLSLAEVAGVSPSEDARKFWYCDKHLKQLLKQNGQ